MFSASVYTITPLTAQCREWVSENVETESWQWLGPTLCIDYHYIDMIIEALEDANFVNGSDFAVGD